VLESGALNYLPYTERAEARPRFRAFAMVSRHDILYETFFVLDADRDHQRLWFCRAITGLP
jgi:hypothetical protein